MTGKMADPSFVPLPAAYSATPPDAEMGEASHAGKRSAEEEPDSLRARVEGVPDPIVGYLCEETEYTVPNSEWMPTPGETIDGLPAVQMHESHRD